MLDSLPRVGRSKWCPHLSSLRTPSQTHHSGTLTDALQPERSPPTHPRQLPQPCLRTHREAGGQGQPSPRPLIWPLRCPAGRHLHLPRLLQHFKPLCLLKLRLSSQQDIPLPGKGARVRGMQEKRGEGEVISSLPTPSSTGPDSPLRLDRGELFPGDQDEAVSSCGAWAMGGFPTYVEVLV